MVVFYIGLNTSQFEAALTLHDDRTAPVSEAMQQARLEKGRSVPGVTIARQPSKLSSAVKYQASSPCALNLQDARMVIEVYGMALPIPARHWPVIGDPNSGYLKNIAEFSNDAHVTSSFHHSSSTQQLIITGLMDQFRTAIDYTMRTLILLEIASCSAYVIPPPIDDVWLHQNYPNIPQSGDLAYRLVTFDFALPIQHYGNFANDGGVLVEEIRAANACVRISLRVDTDPKDMQIYFRVEGFPGDVNKAKNRIKEEINRHEKKDEQTGPIPCNQRSRSGFSINKRMS